MQLLRLRPSQEVTTLSGEVPLPPRGAGVLEIGAIFVAACAQVPLEIIGDGAAALRRALSKNKEQ